MKKKNSSLILKGITHSGEPFTKEIHTLDEVKSSGSYTVICRNASTGEGLPAISGHTKNCFCCEAQLIVTGCYSENESQSDTAYGQTITICDRETGNTATYTRTITPTKNGGKWSEWQMVATGDIELVSQNSDINKQLTTLATEQKAEVTRAIAAEEELRSRKADEDGYHPKMSVGVSDNLVGRGDATESQFTYRPTGGTQSIEDGVARITKIKGNSIVWNQLAEIQETATINGVTIESNGDGSYKVYTALEAPATADVLFPITAPIVGYRKVIFYGAPDTSKTSTYSLKAKNSEVQDIGTGGTIPSTTEGESICIFVAAGTIINTAVTFHPQVFDLTLMFGQGKEPTTIKDFKSLYPKLYEYNTGKLTSLTVNSIKSVGFNLLNLENRTPIIRDEIYEPKSKREFSESQLWNYASANGYFYPYHKEYEYTDINIDSNSISAADKHPEGTHAYGIGFPVKAIGNTNYYINFEGEGLVFIGYFDINGVNISHITINTSTLFTTPNNCAWLLIIFDADRTTGKLNITNINLNLSHTGYRDGDVEPYTEFIRELPIKENFPDGMHSVGEVYDEITKDRIVKRIGTREYQAGDEHDSLVTTDGTTTTYVLDEPVETILHDLLNLDYNVSDFGTEESLSDGFSAPMKADIIYGFNAVDTIRNNREEIQSLLQRIQTLEEKIK